MRKRWVKSKRRISPKLFLEHWDLALVLGDAARAEGTAFGLGELISFFVLLLGYIGDGIGSYFRKGRESMAHPA